MDKDYRFIQDHINEAQRLRNETVGRLLSEGWNGACRLVSRATRSLAAHLPGPTYSRPR